MKNYTLNARIAASIFLIFSSIIQSLGSGNIPRPDHIVVVIMENHSYSDIIGS